MTRSITRSAVALLATVAALPLAAAPALAHDSGTKQPSAAAEHSRDGVGRALAQLRHDLSRYQDVHQALADGFVPTPDCSSSPAGGMGFHYINFSRMMAPIDPAKPSILLYAPDREGQMELLGAEWFQADDDQSLSTADDRPTLFGQPFNGPMLGHEPGMPVHYDLHVWLFKANPDGVFAPWNPRVTCS